MAGAGFDRSGTQCRDKIKKLGAEYRKFKDKHGKTGTGHSSWKFFDDMDKILGHKPATCPPTVIDTSGDHSTEVQISSEDNGNDEGNVGKMDLRVIVHKTATLIMSLVLSGLFVHDHQLQLTKHLHPKNHVNPPRLIRLLRLFVVY